MDGYFGTWTGGFLCSKVVLFFFAVSYNMILVRVGFAGGICAC